ncbi:hypothetical protein PAXRUDRAFT_48624, partial [Paxillus rubicundulus Ve08.2h10]
FSLIAALALDEGIIAVSVVEGPFHHDTFYAFLRDDLLMCNPYPAPQSVLVMDNARIHHSDEIEELVQSFG